MCILDVTVLFRFRVSSGLLNCWTHLDILVTGSINHTVYFCKCEQRQNESKECFSYRNVHLGKAGVNKKTNKAPLDQQSSSWLVSCSCWQQCCCPSQKARKEIWQASTFALRCCVYKNIWINSKSSLASVLGSRIEALVLWMSRCSKSGQMSELFFFFLTCLRWHKAPQSACQRCQQKSRQKKIVHQSGHPYLNIGNWLRKRQSKMFWFCLFVCLFCCFFFFEKRNAVIYVV